MEMNEKKFLNKQALVGLISFALCIILLLVGYLNVKSVSFHKIPVVDMVLPDVNYDMSEVKEATQKEIEKLEDLVDESDLDAKEKAYVDGVIEGTKKFAKNISVNTIKDLADAVSGVDGAFDVDVDGISDSIDELKEAADVLQKAINVMEKIILWFMLIPLAFTVLGGLLRSKGWTIFAMVISWPFYFLLGGAVLGIIATVGYIVQVVVYGKLKKAQKAAEAV